MKPGKTYKRTDVKGGTIRYGTTPGGRKYQAVRSHKGRSRLTTVSAMDNKTVHVKDTRPAGKTEKSVTKWGRTGNTAMKPVKKGPIN